jgi:folate-binding protein YgfZ
MTTSTTSNSSPATSDSYSLSPATVITDAPWQLVEITGKDAEKFLQNRTTNNVNTLQAGNSHWNAVLNKKAQLQGFFALGKQPDNTAFWVTLPQDDWTNAEEALFQYRIIEDIQADSKASTHLSIHGIEAAYYLAQGLDTPIWEVAIADHTVNTINVNGTTATIWRLDVTGQPGYFVWSEGDVISQLKAALTNSSGVQTDDAKWLSEHMVINGLPAMGVDMTTDTLLPETGLESITVSYDKGCYLGQETVARVKTYGAVPKALVGLAFQDITIHELPLQGGILTNAYNDSDKPNEKPIGQLTRCFTTSTLDSTLGIAYLDKAHRTPDSTLELIITDPAGAMIGPVTATVMWLPIETNSDNSDELNNKLREAGLAAFANNQPECAIAQLERALGLAPDNADNYEALGAVLGRLDRYAEAINVTEALTTLEPDRIMAHTNLSVFYMQLGDKERAEDEKATATVLTMKAKMAAAGFTPQNNADAEAAKRKQLEERVAMFKTALANAPTDPLGNFGLGSTLLELGRFDEAAEALEHTVHLPSSQSAAYLKLGQACEGSNQPEKAIAIYTTGVEVASKRRDLQPLNTMKARLKTLTES